MDNRLTLEEQLLMAKARDIKIYIGNVLRGIDGKETPELYDELNNPPISIIRDAERLFAKIMEDEDNGHPISRRYMGKLENISAFVYLLIQDLINIQEQRYFGIFKRDVVVTRESGGTDYS